jgi:hypothetical protein
MTQLSLAWPVDDSNCYYHKSKFLENMQGWLCEAYLMRKASYCAQLSPLLDAAANCTKSRRGAGGNGSRSGKSLQIFIISCMSLLSWDTLISLIYEPQWHTKDWTKLQWLPENYTQDQLLQYLPGRQMATHSGQESPAITGHLRSFNGACRLVACL